MSNAKFLLDLLEETHGISVHTFNRKDIDWTISTLQQLREAMEEENIEALPDFDDFEDDELMDQFFNDSDEDEEDDSEFH